MLKDKLAAYSDENEIRSAKIWVPIDIYKLADALGTESDVKINFSPVHV